MERSREKHKNQIEINKTMKTVADVNRDTFRCSTCDPPNGPLGGCPTQYHDKRCYFR